MPNKNISIAIDGPSGAGKSTLARAVAANLGFIYVDTGALYRTIGLHIERAGADPGDESAVAPLLESAQLSLAFDDMGAQRVFLNGEEVSDFIRTPKMGQYASICSSLPKVREFLLDLQRDMAKNSSVVMDGRDIGTVVLPRADIKIFLTASAEDRAMRRYLELTNKGMSVDFPGILADQLERDNRDESRAAAPLKQAPDAILIDTTGFELSRSLEVILRIIKERMPDVL